MSEHVRRIADVIVAVCVLTIGFPLFVAIGILVFVDLGFPLQYRQERLGYGTQPFVIRKFRTMQHSTCEQTRLDGEAQRISRIGKFLRSTSLDELPSFWNLLVGDLTLVGPRPLPCNYREYFYPKELKRFEVRPGITGLAQINGRNAITWDKRLTLDVRYVDTRTLVEDFRIVLASIPVVFRRQGINNEPSLSMVPLDVERMALHQGDSDAYKRNQNC